MNTLSRITSSVAALAVLGLAAAPAAAAGANTEAMLKLARSSGCTSCHALEPGTRGPDGLAAIGPAWREVAARYRGQPGAVDRLTQAVVAGSNPYDSHWAGKVAGLAMPPNAIVIRPAEARRLVRWILALDAAGKP